LYIISYSVERRIKIDVNNIDVTLAGVWFRFFRLRGRQIWKWRHCMAANCRDNLTVTKKVPRSRAEPSREAQCDRAPRGSTECDQDAIKRIHNTLGGTGRSPCRSARSRTEADPRSGPWCCCFRSARNAADHMRYAAAMLAKRFLRNSCRASTRRSQPLAVNFRDIADCWNARFTVLPTTPVARRSIPLRSHSRLAQDQPPINLIGGYHLIEAVCIVITLILLITDNSVVYLFVLRRTKRRIIRDEI